MTLFFEKVVRLKDDPIKAFCELHSLCIGFASLQEMLLDLLTPEQALTLGPDIYFQHVLRCFLIAVT